MEPQLAKRIVSGLREAGINFVAYLPESRLSQILPLMRKDPFFQLVGVGIGLALALPHRRVVVLESDGSVLLSLFNLPTLARLHPANLAVFVFDNGVYSGSRISEPTATAGRTDLEKIAKSAGIRQATTIRNIRAFKKDGLAALKKKGLRFIVCKVEESLVHRKIPRPTIDLAENKYRFVRYLERTEGKAIPFVGRG